MSNLRVLIIEDKENWQNRLGLLVPQLGPVNLEIAADFETASRKIDTQQYDVAVVDLLLAANPSEFASDEDINLDLLRAIRESEFNKACALIVLTGHGNTDRARRALREYEAYDFVEKDQFDAKRFLATVGAALFNARLKAATVREQRRYKLSVQLGDDQLLSCRLTGPDGQSDYVSRNPPRIELADLARRADNLNLLIIEGGPDIWRPEALSIGKSAWGLLAREERVLGDLRAGQALARETDDFWLEFSGPTASLGVPFELLRDDDYLTFAHLMTRRLTAPMPSLLRKVDSLHHLMEKLLKDRKPIRALVVGSNSDGCIPGAETEAETVATLISNELKYFGRPTDITLLRGAEANYTNVRSALLDGSYHFFHYAGHGRFSDRLPEISGLVLRDGDHSRTITAAELNLLVRKSPLWLAYLSCCLGARNSAQTGRGDFSGVLEALARADIPTVFGYRWTVADEPAKFIAERFYGSLWRNLCPGDALYKARSSSASSSPQGRDDDSWASPVLLMQNT